MDAVATHEVAAGPSLDGWCCFTDDESWLDEGVEKARLRRESHHLIMLSLSAAALERLDLGDAHG